MNRCAAKDCTNTSDQGRFAGDFCTACDLALRTGKAIHGTSWIFALAAELEGTKGLWHQRGTALRLAEIQVRDLMERLAIAEARVQQLEQELAKCRKSLKSG